MINKLHLAVMTPSGLKETEVVKNDSVGYVCLSGDDSVHYCDSDVTLFDFLQSFIDELKNYPSYEKR